MWSMRQMIRNSDSLNPFTNDIQVHEHIRFASPLRLHLFVCVVTNVCGLAMGVRTCSCVNKPQNRVVCCRLGHMVYVRLCWINPIITEHVNTMCGLLMSVRAFGDEYDAAVRRRRHEMCAKYYRVYSVRYGRMLCFRIGHADLWRLFSVYRSFTCLWWSNVRATFWMFSILIVPTYLL